MAPSEASQTDSSVTPPVVVFATESVAYPGADAAGQAHQEYPPSIHLIRVPSPVMLPDDFYLRCFAKGVGGILVASAGMECPFHGAYNRLAARIDRVYQRMKTVGLELERLKLVAICSVCIRAFVKEATQMHEVVGSLGPVDKSKAIQALRESEE